MTTTTRAEIIRMCSAREARVIPEGWQHPKDASGRFVPLLPEGYAFYEDGSSPWPTMPCTDRIATEIAAYEMTSEGTPISPAFPNTAEGRRALCRWCAEHCTTFGDHQADAEAWALIIFGDAGVALDRSVRA